MSIKTCTCAHSAQDKLNGKGNRVHTESTKNTYKCTVCGSIKR